MTFKKPTLAVTLAALVLSAGAVPEAAAKTFTLRIGAGHPSGPVPYVTLMEEFFVPQVEARVADRTDHKVRFIEAYGGTIAKLSEVLEATQKGILDIGHTCFCFEPSKAFANNLNYYVPFTTPNAVQQLKVTRQIYKEFPRLADHLSEDYNQTLIAITGYENYNLGSTFAWDETGELAGRKIGGAGPNLPWIEFTGATVVQSSLNEFYSGLQTGIFEAILAFPGSYYGFKFHEVAEHYKIIDIGAVMVNGMTINNRTKERLPPEVLDIIVEVAAEYELKVAEALDTAHEEGLEKLREAGATITTLPLEERRVWAEKLSAWPNEMAQRVSAEGFDGQAIFRRYIEILEADGHVFPVDYQID
ncbi:MAG: C4-dicarboxylate TRAP transporter substrate-binding protein [Devosia sp.]